jgi:septal ring factor EnvC (AmiA/AmiB activator)
MNRMRWTIVSAALLAAPLFAMGCEDAATTAALKTCTTDFANLQKSASAQESTLKDLKKQLAEVQNKVGQLTKENEELKAAKDKKAEAGDKKSEPKGKKAAGKDKK